MITRMPAAEAANILSAVEAAMALTTSSGRAPDFDLWQRLSQARAATLVHLLGHDVTVEVWRDEPGRKAA